MKKIILYVILIFWMGLIFYFSHQPAVESDIVSDGAMSNVVTIIENIFNRDFNDNEIYNIYEYGIGPLRKCAHVSIYFILGILIYSLLKQYKINNKKVFIISIIFCILYAYSDEMHQLFIPGRSGELKDILIDSLGSLLGIVILKVIYEKDFKHN